MKDHRESRLLGRLRVDIETGASESAGKATDVPDEPSGAEATLAAAFYAAARAEITNELTAGDQTNAQFLTIASAAIAASVTAQTFNVPRLSTVCCVTPVFSFIFAQQRYYQTKSIVALARFIREDFNSYIFDRFPNFRTREGRVPNWEDSNISEKREVSHTRSSTLTSLLTLHLPSMLSLALAGFFLFSSTCKVVSRTGHGAQQVCVGQWTLNSGLVWLYLASMVFWFAAVLTTVMRLKILDRAHKVHSETVRAQRRTATT